jgi:Uma2 family endonuclease
MPVQTLISVGEYLRSSYEHDKEYVDGELVERGMPTFEHGELQAALSAFIFPRRRDWGVRVVEDTRVEVRDGCFRLPDIAVVSERDQPREGVIRVAPICTIEILSPRDSMVELRAKAREYLKMGVRHVWSVDPISRECYEHHEEGMDRVKDGVLRVAGALIEIPIAEIMASL